MKKLTALALLTAFLTMPVITTVAEAGFKNPPGKPGGNPPKPLPPPPKPN